MFASALDVQQEAIFATFGVDAAWSGVSGDVKVIIKAYDDDRSFSRSSRIARKHLIRVQQSAVETPVEGNTVTVSVTEVYTIHGAPMLNRRRVWECEASRTV